MYLFWASLVLAIKLGSIQQIYLRVTVTDQYEWGDVCRDMRILAEGSWRLWVYKTEDYNFNQSEKNTVQTKQLHSLQAWRSFPPLAKNMEKHWNQKEGSYISWRCLRKEKELSKASRHLPVKIRALSERNGANIS